jgi:hypothetical protein
MKAIKVKDIDQAVKVMREVMSSGKDSDRLAAAKLLLDRAIGPIVDADLFERLEYWRRSLTTGKNEFSGQVETVGTSGGGKGSQPRSEVSNRPIAPPCDVAGIGSNGRGSRTATRAANRAVGIGPRIGRRGRTPSRRLALPSGHELDQKRRKESW